MHADTSIDRQPVVARLEDFDARSGSWPERLLFNHRPWVLLLSLLVTLVLGALTWNGVTTLFSMAGSMLATYAMFYMRGVALRLAMIAVAGLWMYNAWAYDSWWQMFGNTLNGVAAAFGAWRAAKTQTTV